MDMIVSSLPYSSIIFFFIIFCVVVDLYALHVAVRLNVFLSQTNSRLALGRQAREPAGYWTGE